MNKDIQNPVSLFQEALLNLLKQIRGQNITNPGEFEYISDRDFAYQVEDMRIFIDSAVKEQARSLYYEYIPTLSTVNRLVFLNAKPTYRRYSNLCEKVSFVYDYDSNKVQEIVISNPLNGEV